ncbi:site-specific DNA-methyltransferase [Sulfuracidifex tepidarius]|nr:site-specific DNA-methyltransferase [Sulfuracidifex tepidarius]
MTWQDLFMIKVIFGDSRNMRELTDESISLVLTSPPYYNAPFGFPDLFPSYSAYLDLLRDVGREVYKSLEKGESRILRHC